MNPKLIVYNVGVPNKLIIFKPLKKKTVGYYSGNHVQQFVVR